MDLRSLWTLDPDVDYLNHGSFGATPRRVLDLQARLRAEMEREPVEFLARRLPGRMEEVRVRLARFLGADPAGLVPVPNATTGVNAVLRGLDWAEGDEVLLADQAYNAVKQSVRYLGARHGVRTVEAKVPFPLQGAAEVTAAFRGAITPRTKLLLLDHITSPTALILPVAELVALGHAHGIPVLIDGAHAPGMLPLALDTLGADFYTGNLHKWLCAPKGAAFLHLAPAWRDRISPLTISHGYRFGLAAEFDWTGTVDPSPWLCVPEAIDWLEELGLETVSAHNHALVRRGRMLLADALGVALPHPDDPTLYGSMATVLYPQGGVADFPTQQALNARMYAEHQIEVPFMGYDGRMLLRISGQLYNTPAQYERLAKVLKASWA